MVYVPLDVSYADDPKIIAAGEKAELLYVRSLALAKRLEVDGVIANHHLPRFGLPGVAARAQRLVDVGLWEHTAGGYRITAWLKHNRPSAEIEELRRKRRAAGKQGGRASAEAKAKQSAEQELEQTVNPRTEVETKPRSPSSVVHLHSASRNGVEDEFWWTLAERKLTEVLANGGRVGNPEAWKRTTAATAKKELGQRLAELTAKFVLTDTELVDALMGRTNVLKTAQRR